MKFTIDIDCTPEEARTFLGLPEVAAMQGAVMEELQKRVMESISAMDPEALFKTWLPQGVEGFEQMQKSFWSQFTAGAGAENERK